MKTKSRDRIRLSSGVVMTLGEALDAGVLKVVESNYYDPSRYFAHETEGNLSWEIGKTLYLSRMGCRLPFGSHRGQNEED